MCFTRASAWVRAVMKQMHGDFYLLNCNKKCFCLFASLVDFLHALVSSRQPSGFVKIYKVCRKFAYYVYLTFFFQIFTGTVQILLSLMQSSKIPKLSLCFLASQICSYFSSVAEMKPWILCLYLNVFNLMWFVYSYIFVLL